MLVKPKAQLRKMENMDGKGVVMGALEEELSNLVGNPFENSVKVEIKSPEEIRNEWLAARRGYFTASCAGQLMGYEDKDELPAGAKTYAKKVAIERMTKFNPDRPNGFKSAAMQWGNDTELQAIAAFEAETGLVCSDTGENQEFLISYFGVTLNDKGELNRPPMIGGTPDGVIYGYGDYDRYIESGVEIKCPNSETHFDYLQIETQKKFKEVCKDYYWQIMQLMLCAEVQHWYFVSFDPDFIDESKRLKILRIDRNEADISKLVKRLTLAIDYAKSLIK